MWKTTITPGFRDADPLRHINNNNIPVWFEQGRIPVFKVFHPSLELDTWPLILARISVDFVKQMRWDANVEILTYIKKYGRSSVTIYQEAYQDNTITAKGECVLVHFDYLTQKSKPIPTTITHILDKHPVNPNNPNLKTRSGRLPPV